MGGLFGGGGQATNTTAPVLGGIRVQTSAYGLPIPLVWGQNRIAANMLWYGDFQAIPHTTTSSSGGGGKGGSPPASTNTTWTYQAAMILGLCEGPIAGVGSIWADKDVHSGKWVPAQLRSVGAIYSFFLLSTGADEPPEIHTVPSGLAISVDHASLFTANLYVTDGSGNVLVGGVDYTISAGVYSFTSAFAGWTLNFAYQYTIPAYFEPATAELGLTLYNGTYPQSAWGYLSSYHAGQAIGYQGVAYAANASMQLDGNASLANLTFEVAGRLQYGAGVVDAAPHDILSDFLNNANYGAAPGFPLGSLTSYMQYCVALGIFLSPALTDQVQASEFVTTLLEMTNTSPVWSDGALKIIPYGDTTVTGNGQTYSPAVTPLYDLTDDDFIFEADADPIIVTRTANADAYNQIKVEYVDRADQYNTNVTQADDLSNIDLYGLRTKDPLQYHAITTLSVARTVAQTRLQRLLYIRNSYVFKLGWRYVMLEPMDIVTLTDAGLGLDKTAVRITSVEEDEDGMLTVQAEDFPAGVGHSAVYGSQISGGYSVNFNASPGNVNPPVIFEAPDTLTVSGLEVFIGASGGLLWGGCEVWVSLDDATYSKAGNITTRARTGYLSANLPSGADPDAANTLSVDLTESRGALTGATQADADAFNTLCYVDGELVSYSVAALTAAYKYSLSGYLRRGVYNSPVGAHMAGTKFCRIDGALFHYPFTADRIGQSIYIKLLSYNVYGSGLQGLADVQPYQYKLTGSAQNSPLPNVVNLTTRYIDGITQITWDAVSDFRTPVDYEVKQGATWGSAKTLGRTPTPSFSAAGDGAYWVSAHYLATSGVHVYSATPSEIVIAGAMLTNNVIVNYDEAALGWAGTLSGAAVIQAGNIILSGAGNILSSANILAEPDTIWYGGVAPSGEYDLPASHAVDIGRIAPCSVMIGYTIRGQSIYDNALTLNDVLSISDWLSDALGVKVGAQPQIALAQADGIYGSWQNFIPGAYNAQYFKARILLTSSDPQVTAILSGLTFMVDVPDRMAEGTVQVPAGGMSVLYSPAFNGGVNGNPVPLPQVTILGAQAGDDVILSAQTLSGFTVQVVNGGSGVLRNINYKSQGY